MMTFGSLPLSSIDSYNNNIDKLTESILQKHSDEEIQTIVEQLNKNLQSSLDKLADIFETNSNVSAYNIESDLDMMGYGTLLHALHEILTRMSKKSKEEAEAMLDRMEIIDGTPSFTTIEKMAVEVMSEIIGNLARFVTGET